MDRRHFLRSLGAGIAGTLPFADSMLRAQPAGLRPPADFSLHIQPVTVELSPKHHVKIIG